MKTRLFALSLSLCFTAAAAADERGKLIFEDNFERNESQEEKEELSNGWGSNSRSRAKGNKQVDLKDGAMFIKTHAEADHPASVTHEAEFVDGIVELRFMLEDEKDTLGLDFADLTDEQKAFLKTTTKRFPLKVDANQWHSMVVTITRDTVAVTIDDKEAGRFTSAGFAHPTKRMLRLAVPQSAVVDDIRIFAKAH